MPSLRFETRDSASMLFRAVDIDLAAYPMLAWRWFIELPIKSPLDERTREGRRSPGAALSSVHHRSRREACDGGDLGESAETGDCKYIGGFPHFVADAGDDRVGRWLDERIDLVRVYAEIWKDAAPAHLVDVAVFCDSDDTHTASISYFAYVRLTAVRFWRPDALGARPGVWRLKEAAVALLKDRILSSRLPLSLGVMTEVEDSLRPQPSEPWPAAGASPF